MILSLIHYVYGKVKGNKVFYNKKEDTFYIENIKNANLFIFKDYIRSKASIHPQLMFLGNTSKTQIRGKIDNSREFYIFQKVKGSECSDEEVMELIDEIVNDFKFFVLNKYGVIKEGNRDNKDSGKIFFNLLAARFENYRLNNTEPDLYHVNYQRLTLTYRTIEDFEYLFLRQFALSEKDKSRIINLLKERKFIILDKYLSPMQ